MRTAGPQKLLVMRTARAVGWAEFHLTDTHNVISLSKQVQDQDKIVFCGRPAAARTGHSPAAKSPSSTTGGSEDPDQSDVELDIVDIALVDRKKEGEPESLVAARLRGAAFARAVGVRLAMPAIIEHHVITTLKSIVTIPPVEQLPCPRLAGLEDLKPLISGTIVDHPPLQVGWARHTCAAVRR